MYNIRITNLGWFWLQFQHYWFLKKLAKLADKVIEVATPSGAIASVKYSP